MAPVSIRLRRERREVIWSSPVFWLGRTVAAVLAPVEPGIQPADSIACRLLAQPRNHRMDQRRKTRSQQRQGIGQRHPLMLEVRLVHTAGMGGKQAVEHDNGTLFRNR